MATLYVKNLPDEIYDALRRQAKANRRSIAAETISLLENIFPHALGTAPPARFPSANPSRLPVIWLGALYSTTQ